MKQRKAIPKSVGTLNKVFYNKCGSKLPYEVWKELIKDCLISSTHDVLEKMGYNIPNDMGKIIILVDEPHKHIETLYSVTDKGECKEIFNFHTFGLVGKFHWKNQPFNNLIRLFKFKPNRDTLKKPLYNIFHANKGIPYINKKEYELTQ